MIFFRVQFRIHLELEMMLKKQNISFRERKEFFSCTGASLWRIESIAGWQHLHWLKIEENEENWGHV